MTGYIQRVEEEICNESKWVEEHLLSLDTQVAITMPEDWHKRQYYGRRQVLESRLKDLQRAVQVFNVRSG